LKLQEFIEPAIKKTKQEQLPYKNLHLTIENCIYHTHKRTLKSFPYIQIAKSQCDSNFSKNPNHHQIKNHST
jgi:hypothetical protein